MNQRLHKVRKLIKSQEAILISSVPHIFYLTGFSNFSREEREAYVLMTRKKNYIFTDGRYREAVEEHVKGFELKEIGRTSLREMLKNVFEGEKIKTLKIEENNLTVSEEKILTYLLGKLKDANLETLRVIKERQELGHIRKACALGDRLFQFILKKLKVGITEQGVAWEMEQFVRRNGAELSFPPIVAFGKNSSVPHHHTGQKKLGKKNGQFVLLDFGTKVNGYSSDMTRTVFWGKTQEKQKKMYRVVAEAQERAAAYIRKNIDVVTGGEADQIARQYLISQGFSSIPHSLGHGIGLEVHESPRLSPGSQDVLKNGMVFSIEPGIYLPRFGGVRIEDLYAITKEKLLKITKAPHNLIEL